MHHLRRKKAIETYSGKEVSKEILLADNYTAEEVDEILEALNPTQAGPVEDKVQEPQVGEQPQEHSPFNMAHFEEWEVTVEYKSRFDDDLNKVTDRIFKKKGTNPIRTTKIEYRHAEVLNTQAENTKRYFYLKK